MEEGGGIVRAINGEDKIKNMAQQSDTWRVSNAGERMQMTARVAADGGCQDDC